MKLSSIGLPVGLGLATVALLVGTFLVQEQALRSEVEKTFHSRSELVAKLVTLHRDQVTVLRNLILQNLSTPLPTTTDPSLGTPLGAPVWELPDVEGRLGRLSGRTVWPFKPEVRHEINAVTAMDIQIAAALEDNSEVTWIYYLSAEGFLYLAPKAAAHSFQFTEELYQRGYWQESFPQANPTGRMTLQGPYQDLAGSGRILTFAQPVRVGDRFLGVVALDIQVRTLEELLRLGQAVGESFLVSENDQLITQPLNGGPGLSLPPIKTTKLIDWQTDARGDQWLSNLIVPQEMWLVHRVRAGDWFFAAARASLLPWLLTLLAVAVAIFAWRLRQALAEVERLTRIDPLTQLLNRRGFFEAAPRSLAASRRQTTALAVLIMDIDHFKKINDVHGHGAGDTVLTQVAAALRQTQRTTDLVCRWGGEEFVCLLEVASPDQARTAAERLRQAAQLTPHPDGDRTVTLSGGLVRLSADEGLEAAISRADQLLYQAKASGRNQICQATAELDPRPPTRPN